MVVESELIDVSNPEQLARQLSQADKAARQKYRRGLVQIVNEGKPVTAETFVGLARMAGRSIAQVTEDLKVFQNRREAAQTLADAEQSNVRQRELGDQLKALEDKIKEHVRECERVIAPFQAEFRRLAEEKERERAKWSWDKPQAAQLLRRTADPRLNERVRELSQQQEDAQRRLVEIDRAEQLAQRQRQEADEAEKEIELWAKGRPHRLNAEGKGPKWLGYPTHPVAANTDTLAKARAYVADLRAKAKAAEALAQERSDLENVLATIQAQRAAAEAAQLDPQEFVLVD